MSKPPTTLPINYLIAGDISYQSMRIEEKTSFPVHRYGLSYDVHRHRSISGTFLIKFLVEQCHEYDLLKDGNFDPVPTVELADKIDLHGPSEKTSRVEDLGLPHRKLCASLNRAKVTSENSIKAVVWKSVGKNKNNEDIKLDDTDLYHESVAIIRETDVQEKAKEADTSLLRGFRITDTHSLSDFEEVKEIKEGLTGERLKESDLVLSLDMQKFGGHGEFEKLKELHQSNPFGNLVTRLVIPRAASNQPNSKSKFDDFSNGFIDFLEEYCTSREERRKYTDAAPDSVGVSVLIISSESLRNAGFDISYRVAWERSITGVLRCLREGTKLERGKKVKQILGAYDYLIVNFYNDGALLIDNRGDDKINNPAVLAAIPSQTEGDHHRRFEGTTKGTESMIASCVAYRLRRKKDDEEAKLGTWEKLQIATVHGLKASRYLQSHGFSTLHQYTYLVLNGEEVKKDKQTDDKMRAVTAMVMKEVDSKSDVLRYLWNRTRATQFAKQGYIPDAMDYPEKIKQPNSRICAWPFGDVIEILASGYPMFGSFPPISLNIDEGRDAVDKETRKVMAAWNDSGWIEVGRFKQSDAYVPNMDSTRPFLHHHFWSFRSVAVRRLADALQKGSISAPTTTHIRYINKDTNEEIKWSEQQIDQIHLTVARFLMAEMLVRFGTRQINRSNMSLTKHFDIKLLERITLFCNEEIPIPAFYAYYFDGFKMVEFIKELTGQHFEENLFQGKFEIGSLFEQHDWLKLPACGSSLGIFPGFSIKKLHTIDRRDTQSYRDIRERLLGFKNSDDKKPLNLLVLGSPGSGKSFAVKQILSGVYEGEDIAFLEYNVASFAGGRAAITSAFLEIQNVALQDKLPVVFWDEYDTSVGDTPLGWLGNFLGPMQDGKFLMDQSSRFLPKCVFVFAGSVFSRFDQIRLLDWQLDAKPIYFHPESPDADEDQVKKEKVRADGAIKDANLDSSKSIFPCCSGANLLYWVDEKKELHQSSLIGKKRLVEQMIFIPVIIDAWRKAKGRDFKSRITGVLDITPLDWLTENEIIFGQTEDEDAWLFRRASAVRSTFEEQAKHLLNNRDGELQIANETLFSFLTVDCFEHGFRSVESIVRMSSLHGRAIADGSVVPAESQMRTHSQSDFFHPHEVMTYKEMARKFDDAQQVRKQIIGDDGTSTALVAHGNGGASTPHL